MTALTYIRESVYYDYRHLPVEILHALIDCICAAPVPLNSGDKRNEDSSGKHAHGSCKFVCKCIVGFVLLSFPSPIYCFSYYIQ